MDDGPLPYIGSSIENLTLSDPLCRNDTCKAFYDAHQLSQKLVSWYHQFDYGHYVTWYYLACIGVFSVVYFWRLWNERRYNKGLQPMHVFPTLQNRVVALWRSLAYRRYPGWISNRFGLPSVGLLAFLLFAVLFLSLLTFWARPYYRRFRGYGSPPLAIRTGLMATALIPLLIALAGKANPITALTGIGHEKLNVIHRWVSWMCFALSVIHTVPFIVAPLREGGYATLKEQFYSPGGFEYTGVPPLAMLFGLVVFSLPWIRHRVYETFYHVHIWLAVSFVGLMFWHSGNLEDSWAYLWASIAIWLASALTRIFWFTRPTRITSARWLIGSPINVKVFPDNMTCLEILAPTDFRWTPGQHVYLRIPGLAPLDNHPFTIASLDQQSDTNNEKREDEHRILPLYVRSYAGFTRRLRHHLEVNPDTQLEAWLEGPYGGHHGGIGVNYDNIILIAGGGGVSAVLPWFEYFAQNTRLKAQSRPTSVKLYWSVRTRNAMTWISEAIEKLHLSSLKPNTEMFVHVTGEGEARVEEKTRENVPITDKTTHHQDSQRTSDFERSEKHNVGHKMLNADTVLRHGRIDFKAMFNDLPPGSRTIVIGCGPESLKVDLSNACAQAQSMSISGQVAGIALWTETFGW